MATILTNTSAHATAAFARPRAGLAMFRMIAVARQRRDLAAMDDAQLRDLGLTRAMANAEAERRFWDLDGLPNYR
jgi:uncharacterized protein YjiS (DUF1127 family)